MTKPEPEVSQLFPQTLNGSQREAPAANVVLFGNFFVIQLF